jgi:hypothetical protein
MIKYRLACDRGHDFDSWFDSSAAYDKLEAGGLLSCAVCGSAKVAKAIMAPRVKAARDEAGAGSGPRAGHPIQAAAAADPKLREKLKELREYVEKNYAYVGDRFAEEARKIHYGETEDKPIYGEATLAQAKELVEEGVPVAPLPFVKEDA